jgi:hypothetical protein
VLAWLASACGAGTGDEVTVGPDSSAPEVARVAELEGVHSGTVDIFLTVNKLKKDEWIGVRVAGGFKRLGEGGLPQFYMAASSQGRWNGHTIGSLSHLTVLPDEALVGYGPRGEEKVYGIEGPSLDELRSKFEQAQENGEEGNVAACLEAAQEANLGQLIRSPKIDGHRKEPDGTGVVIVVGEVNVPRLRSLLVEMLRDPDCGAQARALGLPLATELAGAKVDFGKGLTGARLTLAVDRHGVLRDLSTRFECARLNGEPFELGLNFILREVNAEVGVFGSPKKDSLDTLLRKFGIDQVAALQAGGDEALIAFLEALSDSITERTP